MKNLVRSLAKKWFLEGRGNAIIKQTPPDQVNAFIEQLRPYDPGIDLIRVGPNGDGGYLVPDDLEGIDACFSPGVSIVSEFEMDCYKRGMQLFLADKSVDKPNISLEASAYHFLKKHVGCTNTEDLIALDTWVDEFYGKSDTDMLLQMDIEGAEYLTLAAASNKLLSRCRIIVIEFHELHKLWNPEFYRIANEVITKILQTHSCVHIHPNNCIGLYSRLNIQIPPVAEFTFLRNDRFVKKSRQTKFPHHLDFDNVKRDPIVLPQVWYAENA